MRHNPTWFVEYFVTCAMGEDLFNMRKVVREKATANIKERQIEVPATPSLDGAALQDRLLDDSLEASSFRATQDK